MPIYCNNYDINLYQGQSYFLDLDYTDANDEVVDLNGATFEARMQVRRSPLVDEKLIAISSDFYPRGVVGGGNTGYFTGPGFGLLAIGNDTPGVLGTGGITLNYGGELGTIRIEIDAETTANVPAVPVPTPTPVAVKVVPVTLSVEPITVKSVVPVDTIS